MSSMIPLSSAYVRLAGSLFRRPFLRSFSFFWLQRLVDVFVSIRRSCGYFFFTFLVFFNSNLCIFAVVFVVSALYFEHSPVLDGICFLTGVVGWLGWPGVWCACR